VDVADLALKGLLVKNVSWMQRVNLKGSAAAGGAP
jgi:hypothetical protein